MGSMGRAQPQSDRPLVPRGDLRSPRTLRASSTRTSAARLVAADPDSLSGKERKARDYGIPVVTEDGFARLLAEYQRSVAARFGRSSSGVRR